MPRTDTEAETPILGPHYAKSWLIRKDPDAGKDWRQEKEMTEDEMIGWHHRLNGHGFEHNLGDGEGQRSLACFNPWVVSSWTWLRDWTTHHMPRKAPWTQSQWIIQGHNESCSSQKPLLWDPSWLRCARTPQGRVLRQRNQGGNKAKCLAWEKAKTQLGELPPCEAFKLLKGVTRSLSSSMCLSTCTFFFNKLFTLLFIFCFLDWICSWLGRQN